MSNKTEIVYKNVKWHNFASGNEGTLLSLSNYKKRKMLYGEYLDAEEEIGVIVDSMKHFVESKDGKGLIQVYDRPSAFPVFLIKITSIKWKFAHKMLILVRVKNGGKISITDGKYEDLEYIHVSEIDPNYTITPVISKLINKLYKLNQEDAKVICEYLSVFVENLMKPVEKAEV